MTVLPKTPMTVDEFLAWAEEQPGRYDLSDGLVHAMAPEGAGHTKAKFAIQTALAAGTRSRRLPCHMLPDGMTVRIDETTAHEPDALVYRRKPLIVHHARSTGETLLTRIVTDGVIQLDPPGLELAVADVYG